MSDPRDAAAVAYVDTLLRDVEDFPKPGVVFKDITPLLADPLAFAEVVEAMARPGRDAGGRVVVDKVAGMEARGFVFGAPVALCLGVGFVPVRKAGKLPRATHQVSYALEYADATLEVHQDAFGPGDRVLVVDDVLATGGTAAATRDLVERTGATPVGLSVILELSGLHGRSRIDGLPLHALSVL